MNELGFEHLPLTTVLCKDSELESRSGCACEEEVLTLLAGPRSEVAYLQMWFVKALKIIADEIY